MKFKYRLCYYKDDRKKILQSGFNSYAEAKHKKPDYMAIVDEEIFIEAYL